jgi:hypothetical protein
MRASFLPEIYLSIYLFRGGPVPSDLGVRNNQTSLKALCLWNDTTLPVTRFLGFNTRRKRSSASASASGSCCSFTDREREYPCTLIYVAYATATTCCAVGARAVGTRRGDGPSRGLASKADGWGRLAARDGAGPEGGWGNKWWVRWRGASASSEVPLRR